MSNTLHSVHRTIVTQFTAAQWEGWEFICKECGFQMRYHLPECSEAAHLEVISLGDGSVRHLSEISSSLRAGDTANDEAWLTPELRQTIEEIFQRFDD